LALPCAVTVDGTSASAASATAVNKRVIMDLTMRLRLPAEA
jgi:hypothetical protein